MPSNDIYEGKESFSLEILDTLFKICENISPAIAQEVYTKLRSYIDSIESLFPVEAYTVSFYEEVETNAFSDTTIQKHHKLVHTDAITLIRDWFLSVMHSITTAINGTTMNWRMMWRLKPILDNTYDYETRLYYYSMESRIILWQDKEQKEVLDASK